MYQIVPIKGLVVTSYLIFGEDEIAIIDGGFIGDLPKIKRLLAKRGKTLADIDHILLTHGHLDHTLNVRSIKEVSQATVYGSPLETDHIMGAYPYTGNAKICGYLERLGRWVLNYQPFELDEYLEDGQPIAICGGIQTVHLPGHTVGHLGFYHLPSDILFSGDLFEHSTMRIGLPPYFFNSCPELLPGSLAKVIALGARGIYPNHCNHASPEIHLEKLIAFYQKHFGKS